jgi:hypothetical protein
VYLALSSGVYTSGVIAVYDATAARGNTGVRYARSIVLEQPTRNLRDVMNRTPSRVPQRSGTVPANPAPNIPATSVVSEQVAPAEPSSVELEAAELEQVVRGGMNARQAIEAILGADQLSGDIETDCRAAMAAIDEWQRLLPWRRGLILHTLHDQVHEKASQDPNPAKRDPWVFVALLVGRAIPTVRKWSHPPGWEDDQD